MFYFNAMLHCSLTPSVPVYEIFVLRNHALSCYFRSTLQLRNSPGHCARKLFKPSKDVASLLDCIEKKLESFGLQAFCG